MVCDEKVHSAPPSISLTSSVESVIIIVGLSDFTGTEAGPWNGTGTWLMAALWGEELIVLLSNGSVW